MHEAPTEPGSAPLPRCLAAPPSLPLCEWGSEDTVGWPGCFPSGPPVQMALQEQMDLSPALCFHLAGVRGGEDGETDEDELQSCFTLPDSQHASGSRRVRPFTDVLQVRRLNWG